MGFRENLLKKIRIDELAARVTASLKGPDSGIHFDRQAMQELLEYAPYTHVRERDLDLYVRDDGGGVPEVLVLDNGLPIYHTDIQDVALRKSPTVREMISIRNAIRILNDGDVRVSKREDSVETVRRRCLENLDLRYRPEDIRELEIDGTASLESAYLDGVVETLTLFAELLGYRPPPAPLRVDHVKMWGRLEEGAGGDRRYGPIVLYSLVDNRLSLVKEPVSTADDDAAARLRQVARGRLPADAEGADVFRFLRRSVLEGPQSVPPEQPQSDFD